MRLGVVIPAYQAQQTLAQVWRRLPPRLDLAAALVVNDGSRDDTSRVAHALAASDSRLQVLDLPHNRGYGGAVQCGLARLRPLELDAVACVHADGQYAPEALPDLLQALRQRGLDLLQGSRIASGTALSGGMPLYKYLAGLGLTRLENRVLGLGLSDYHSGYMVFGRRVLQQVPLGQLSKSFDFDLEVIACARALGLAVGEHPVPTHYGEERSHLNPLTYGLRVLRVMFNYRLGRYHRLARAQRGTPPPRGGAHGAAPAMDQEEPCCPESVSRWSRCPSGPAQEPDASPSPRPPAVR